ncbi:hypothetical protein [Leucobacter tardus]|uniref:Uncharacterized protein n=1 Tax=Leucobacter tardus TaxID=501483 RepID=A0A939QJI4_9MICO|nr:hypothetical protein [Leucobacter tardus]MBO2988869.1 hypothetical protein [Leucobacter tardus]
MTAGENGTSDDFIRGLSQLPGWEECLEQARKSETDRTPFGQMVSSLLVATDDGERALALSGQLNAHGVGQVAVITVQGILHLLTKRMGEEDGEELRFELKFHSFGDLRNLSVRTSHNSFNDVEGEPRHARMSFIIDLPDRSLTFAPVDPSHPEPLVNADAILTAYRAVRAGMSGQG